MSEVLVIHPFRGPARGLARVPGSKSVTNRALILAALAEGETILDGALFSRDTHILCTALRELGFSITEEPTLARIRVIGLGGKIPKSQARLHVGNAGTAARFLTALLCLCPDGTFKLDGDDAMRARPMAGLLRALEGAGAKATAADGGRADGFPLTLRTAGMTGGEILCDASASSQMLSALLMVAPLAPGLRVTLSGSTVSEPFVTMTERMVADFGRPLSRVGSTWSCASPGPYRARGRHVIEPDATAASYFVALPAVAGKGSSLRLASYAEGGLQGDVAFAGVARSCGASLAAEGVDCIATDWSALQGGDFDFNAFSDTFLTLAALGPILSTPLTIRGIAHTRRQETDRLLAMATELTRLGAHVEPTPEALRANPSLNHLTVHPSRETIRQATLGGPVRIQTYEDHRVAMSFAILGSLDLHGDGRPWVEIEDPKCVGKTFPGFYAALEALRGRFVQVAVDGGAASGKSSTSRKVAEAHGLMHVDTGSHYRAVTLALLRRGVAAGDAAATALALRSLKIGTRVRGLSAQVELDGELPEGAELRSAEVTAVVSPVAALPEVRAFLLGYQRDQVEIARRGGFAGIIMEGRDIGSVVLPCAEVRIFLEADTAVRSARREAEGVRDAIAQRDQADSSRQVAPLTCPAGANRIDNTHLTLEEVAAQVGNLIRVARS
jgi:3-phosphoshikimate 1-carboxyvinyltransferase